MCKQACTKRFAARARVHARLVFGAPSLLRLSRDGGPVALEGQAVPLEDLLDPDPNDPRLFRSCAGGVQGRSFSTLASVCTYWEEMHVVQKRHPTT